MPPKDFMVVDTSTITSLLCTLVIFVFAYLIGRFLLPSRYLPPASITAGLISVWLVFDALTHFFVYYRSLAFSSYAPFVTFTPNQRGTPLLMAVVWQRFGTASNQPTLSVLLARLAVIFAGPMSMFIAVRTLKQLPTRHMWTIALSIVELYAVLVGFANFTPERLVGKPAEYQVQVFYQWEYFFFFQMLWVVIPGRLLWDAVLSLWYPRRDQSDSPTDEVEDIPVAIFPTDEDRLKSSGS